MRFEKFLIDFIHQEFWLIFQIEAICNRFLTEKVYILMMILICTFSQETCVLTVNHEATLKYIHDMISNRWVELKHLCIKLYYSLPGHKKCLLRCDDDVGSMLCVADSYGTKRVEVEVIGDGIIGSSSTYSDGNALLDEQLTIGNDDSMLQCLPYSNDKHRINLGWDKLIVKVGQRFDDGAPAFRDALQKLSIHTGFQYVYTKNHANRISAVCLMKDERNCGWMVHAVKDSSDDSFCLMKLCNVHTCGTSSRYFGVSRMSSPIAEKLIRDLVRDTPSTSPTDVKKIIFSQFGYEVSYDIAWNAVRIARDSLYGSIQQSFNRLPAYKEAVSQTNPGSVVLLDVDPDSRRFVRMFVAFDACIRGFNDCRPMLFLDGAHLKCDMKGHLLAATGKDGDNGLFPLCYAVVDSENEENWRWFLLQLKSILIPERRMTFLTDRNIGLLDALPTVFPDAYHSYCLYHLKNNLKNCFSGKKADKSLRDRMVKLLLKCAYASTRQEFHNIMDKMLREGGKSASTFFKNLNPTNWANAYFPGCRYGHTASSAAESFNSWVFNERHLPVLNMVDGIRLKIMKQLSVRRAKCTSWNSMICPKVDATLYDLMDTGRNLTVIRSTDYRYEVLSFPSASVNLEFCACSCNEWQRNGYPCVHGVAVIRSYGLYLHEYVDISYLTQSYADSYKNAIFPISGSYGSLDSSSKDIVVPPIPKRQPGRPRKKRIRSTGESMSSIKSGGRHVIGKYNKKACTRVADI